MPGYDGTGPGGEGPITGGGRGRCNPSGSTYARPGVGRGLGFGRRSGQGPGKGYGRRGFYPGGRRWSGPAYGYGTAYDSSYPMSRGEEVNMLRDEADALSSDLNEINRRIKELEKGPAE